MQEIRGNGGNFSVNMDFVEAIVVEIAKGLWRFATQDNAQMTDT